MSAIVTKAPNKINGDDRPRIFLAGSIEMGTAEDWQSRLTSELLPYDVHILNPRRDDWDSSWVQSKVDPQFRKQVLWEQNALDQADIIVFYFAPGTMSPITLMEFGQYVSAPATAVIVFCPDGFWRKGNVDIVSEIYGVNVHSEYEEFIADVIDRVKWSLE